MLSFKRITAIAVLTVLGAQGLASAAWTSRVPNGANARFDYVYTESSTGSVMDQGSNIVDKDNENVEVFSETDTTDQYLVMGMLSKFDTVFFTMDAPAEFADEDSADLKWEYSTSNGWETLKVDDSDLENFTQERSGDYEVSFSIPSDWESGDYQTQEAYWIRVQAKSTVDNGAMVDQVTARAYNVKISLENEAGDDLTALSSKSFSVSGGDDNEVYGIRNLDNGVYELALQAEASDTSYNLVVSAKNHWQVALDVSDVSTKQVSVSYGNLAFDQNCEAPYVDIDFHWAQSAIRELYCRGVIEKAKTFGPNQTINRVEFVKMLMLAAGVEVDRYEPYPMPFGDVSDEDKKYVSAAYQLGIVEEADDFEPNKSLSRAQAITMMVRLAGIETDSGETPFSDVSDSAWYAPYVKAAYDYDMVEGYDDGTFRPTRRVSNAESAMMMNNVNYSLDSK